MPPLFAARCPSTTLHIVSELASARDSLASVRVGEAGRRRSVRVGARIDGWRVVHIGYDPRRASPAVWLEADGQSCQVTFAPPPRPEPAKPELVVTSPPRPRSYAERFADRIEATGDRSFKLDRQALQDALDHLPEMSRGLRTLPVRDGDAYVGLRLFGLAEGSVLSQLGIHDGDLLKKVNGFELTDPSKALQAYAQLQRVSDLRVEIERAGQPLTLEYAIE
jgi:general secretion pathway protein C